MAVSSRLGAAKAAKAARAVSLPIKKRFCGLSFGLGFTLLVGVAGLSVSADVVADVVAPQAPPELSDTLTDFRTKEQLTEQVYIEGLAAPQNSIEVPTVPGDLESKVMRMSATYQAQYEVAVPRHGASILRFYDLNGYPMEIVSTKVENQGFIAEVTASPSELMIRQYQGAATTMMRVRLKGINRNFIFTLKPLVLFNQQASVRTLITSMTVNYYVENANYIKPEPYKFGQPNPQAESLNFDSVDQKRLEQDLVRAAAIVMPLSKKEQELAEKARALLQQGESTVSSGSNTGAGAATADTADTADTAAADKDDTQ